MQIASISLRFALKMFIFWVHWKIFENLSQKLQFLTRNYPKLLGLTRPDPKNWVGRLTRPGPTREDHQLPDPTRGSKSFDPQHPYALA